MSSPGSARSVARTWRTDAVGSASARLLVADANEDPPEPRLESLRIAEARQLTPGRDERLLDGILGAVEVAQDALGHGEQPVGIGARQEAEGLSVSVPRRLDQLSIQRRTFREAALVGPPLRI